LLLEDVAWKIVFDYVFDALPEKGFHLQGAFGNFSPCFAENFEFPARHYLVPDRK
jgi:hypothetical protein